MKLGDVLKKERERKRLSSEEMATKLGIPDDQYREMEAGSSPAEQWGPLLARVAIKLETPTSRACRSPTAASRPDTHAGQAGQLIRKHRERRGKSVEQMAEELGDPASRSTRPSRPAPRASSSTAQLLLNFAEVIEQPRCSTSSTRAACRSTSFPEVNDYP